MLKQIALLFILLFAVGSGWSSTADSYFDYNIVGDPDHTYSSSDFYNTGLKPIGTADDFLYFVFPVSSATHTVAIDLKDYKNVSLQIIDASVKGQPVAVGTVTNSATFQFFASAFEIGAATGASNDPVSCTKEILVPISVLWVGGTNPDSSSAYQPTKYGIYTIPSSPAYNHLRIRSSGVSTATNAIIIRRSK